MFVGVIEFLGWFGAGTVLAGYLLFSLGKIPNGPVYQLFNLVGGIAVAVNVAAHHAVPSTIVNGIWAVVAAVVLVRMGLRRRRSTSGAPTARSTDLHAELPTTTAVLPVIGPALRDHEADVTATPEPAPGLPVVSGGSTGTGTDAPAPMTESVPVITATIALALVRAATEQHAIQQQATQQHATPQRASQHHAAQHHAPEPERADAP
ncbi:hypothetical protein DEI97_016075 [Curtobacterium sp. MCLR17_032]|uniref:CBU_0592 family membrane protein n=1 Tax=Curtobacterium sp. MCLR17_032 TaxID=2175650 RepID=UPI000DA6F683|nr:hypothetical protein [Curtobacterium sp. MCLR17_032]WIE61237.1 hypothetical protein DEI97_016075 [Curtobacterium sp. MCLR17_032]